MSHAIVVPLGFQYVLDQPLSGNYFDFISHYPKDELIKAFSYRINKAESYGEELIKNRDDNAHIKFLSEFELNADLQKRVLTTLAEQNDAYTLFDKLTRLTEQTLIHLGKEIEKAYYIVPFKEYPEISFDEGPFPRIGLYSMKSNHL